MKVTPQLLRDLNACPEQVKLFSKLYPDGVSYETQEELQLLVDKASKQGLNVGWFIERMKLSCVWREYYENGQLRCEGNYKDGERDGGWNSYYENGQLWCKSNYKNGKRDGVWNIYYENGQLKGEWSYEEGALNGVWRYYHNDGRTVGEKKYKNNELYNVYREYCENRQLKGER